MNKSKMSTKAHYLARKDLKDRYKLEHRLLYLSVLTQDDFANTKNAQPRAYMYATTLLTRKYSKEFEELLWRAKDAVEYEELHANCAI